MTRLPVDPQTDNVKDCCALIYAPGRRDRFPENCVEVVESEAHAIERADAQQKLFAARVIGPCRSSEGFMLYYLIRWLE